MLKIMVFLDVIPCQTSWCHNPQSRNPNIHYHVNLKYDIRVLTCFQQAYCSSEHSQSLINTVIFLDYRKSSVVKMYPLFGNRFSVKKMLWTVRCTLVFLNAAVCVGVAMTTDYLTRLQNTS
jgi:hypothetical protein